MAGDAGRSLVSAITVALQSEWVPRSRYRMRPPAVMAVFDRLLANATLDFQHASAIEYALDLMGESKRSDSAGCIHLALAADESALSFMTLDEDAAKLPGGSLLSAEVAAGTPHANLTWWR